LINRPLSTDNRISLIEIISSNHNEAESVKGLRGDDAQAFVDVIDETLDLLAPSLRKKCLATLCKICGYQGLLPKSMQIPLCHNPMDNPLARGGYAEVWKGEYQGGEVAVKVLKVCQTSDLDKITRRFCKEVVTWKTLRHENVLPLLGVIMSHNQFAMVSEWMANGSINEFIRVHEDANRFELLKGVVRGLIFMHGEGMIHGDLKGANILIDQRGHPCLADFGLITFISDPENSITSHSYSNAGTTRWMSPELLDPEHFGFEDGPPTKDSDCYALGMVIFEVLSGHAPFARDKDWIVVLKVIRGERPERPEGAWFTNDLWTTLKQCWSPLPKDRPTLEAVLDCLGRIPAPRPLPSTNEMEGLTHLVEVPQTLYQPSTRQGFWVPCVPVEFWGIKLTDALNPAYAGLQGATDEVLDYMGVGTSISCRLNLFSGRVVGTSKILTRDMSENRQPITKKKLTFEVARFVQRYVDDIKDEPGYADVTFENLVLMRLIHVSKASWQPVLYYEAPVPRSDSS